MIVYIGRWGVLTRCFSHCFTLGRWKHAEWLLWIGCVQSIQLVITFKWNQPQFVDASSHQLSSIIISFVIFSFPASCLHCFSQKIDEWHLNPRERNDVVAQFYKIHAVLHLRGEDCDKPQTFGGKNAKWNWMVRGGGVWTGWYSRTLIHMLPKLDEVIGRG
jgi:hypothetical protein